MFIDSHAHLTGELLLSQVGPLLSRAQAAHVSQVINICTDIPSLEAGLALQERYPWIYNVAATTPHDVEKEGESFFPAVEKQARAKKLVAIGETGLDYHYEHSPKALQQHYLVKYFQLAVETNLPIVFHCREAFADLFSLADKHYKGKKAILHCFTGTLAEAHGCLERGWLISFSGIVTFKKSDALRAVAASVPLESLLIETDAPYLAPLSQRGKMNEPAYIPEVYNVLAGVKGVTVEVLAQQVKKNLCGCLGLALE